MSDNHLAPEIPSEIQFAPEALPEVLADDPGAHVFRHRVAVLLASQWRERARGLVNCGEAGARVDCVGCGREHVTPYRCGARSCPTCAHLASAVAVEKLAARSEGALGAIATSRVWDGRGPERRRGWKLLTLTSPAHGEGDERFEAKRLRAQLRTVRRAWGPFWRSTPWGQLRLGARCVRRDTCYAIGLEVAPGGIVHLHAAIYGEYAEHGPTLARWRAALGQPVKVIDLRAMRAESADDFRSSLREVLKYVTKGDKEPGVREERAALIELAMKNLRRVELGGALRGAAAKLAVTSLDLVHAEGRACESCGEAHGWRWRGVRPVEYVRRNGAFGIVTRGQDGTDHRRRFRAYLDHKYHGGAAPAWIDEEPYELLRDEPVAAAASAVSFPFPITC